MLLDDKKHLDIAIIQPPGWSKQNPPLGLALLKSYLAESGFAVKNFDLNIILYNIRHGLYTDAWELANGYYMWGSESYVKQMFSYYSEEIYNFIYTVLSNRPRSIGISVHWSSLLSARLLARKFKQVSPGIKIIFGGPQVARYTSTWKTLLKERAIDAVIFGEGEESLQEYLNGMDSADPGPVKGAAFLSRQGDVVEGAEREPIRSLDDIPFADFSDFDLNLYFGRNVLPTYFSRGCINHCCYCTENKFFPKFRNRTGKRLFDEVVRQLSLYPQTDYFRMHDSISNGSIKELETFCDLLIDNKVKIRFNLENAIVRKEMDDRFYKKLRKAGCVLIGYGLETPSKRLLKYIGKAACLDADFEKVVADGVRNKMTIGVNMMFGLPGETKEDFQEQLQFIKRLRRFRARMIINPALNFCYFPEGCEAQSNPDKFNLDLTNGELYWESRDGQNRFADRLAKFEEFCSLADRLGFFNLFNVTRNVNKNSLLGQYYLVKKDYKTALGYLLRSFESEVKTAEVAGDIIKLYEAMHKEHDEVYSAVKSFIESENKSSAIWSSRVNNGEELNQFILQQSISSSMDRLNRFIESRRSYQIIEFRWSLPGLREYIKQTILKLFERTLYRVDSRYVVLTQLLREMDNKIDAAGKEDRNAPH